MDKSTDTQAFYHSLTAIVRFVLRIPRNLAKLAIRMYQFLFSFDHSFWAKYVNYRVCVHEPSCSQFTYEAIDRFGVIKGGVMGFFRILRCNPYTHGGYDPVPDHFTIRPYDKEEYV